MRPTVIELFAGAGGMMLGLEQAGFQTVVANEVHPHPCLTLGANFPRVPILQQSISELGSADLLAASKLSRTADIDLVAGGPPCQGFSTAGLKDVDDPRNGMIGEFLRIVRELRPNLFLLENVPGLMSLHGGKLFQNLLGELDRTGYAFSYKVVFAADYGLPQMRKRLIVLGSRGGPRPRHAQPTHQPKAKLQPGLLSLPAYITCGDALGDMPAIGQGEIAREYSKAPSTPYQYYAREGARELFNHEASRHKEETMQYYSLVPPGGTWLDIAPELRKKKQGMQRWPLDGLSRAITTEPTDFLHPTLDRIPTVRELARIQGFPDQYRFLGQRTTGNKMRRLGYCSQTQQVGNALPPPIARAMGRELISLLGK